MYSKIKEITIIMCFYALYYITSYVVSNIHYNIAYIYWILMNDPAHNHNHEGRLRFISVSNFVTSPVATKLSKTTYFLECYPWVLVNAF